MRAHVLTRSGQAQLVKEKRNWLRVLTAMNQVDRLLDLRHDSRLNQLERGFGALGKHIKIVVEDVA